jgi:hypothetical protein
MEVLSGRALSFLARRQHRHCGRSDATSDIQTSTKSEAQFQWDAL